MGVDIQASEYDRHKARSLFKDNGFIIIRGLIDKQEIHLCNDALLKGMNVLSECNCHDLLEGLIAAFNKTPDMYRSYLRTFAKSVKIQKIFLNDHVLRIIEDLGVENPSTPTTPVTHVVSNQLTSNEISAVTTTSHQDWTSIQGSIDSVVVWIPMMEVNSDNYPVQVLPGSHRNGLRECVIQANVSQISLNHEEEMCYIDITCNPGDVIVFSTFLVHRTKAVGKSFRFAISNRFDNMNEKSFRIRSFPCAYVRIVDRNLTNVPDNEYIKKTLSEV